MSWIGGSLSSLTGQLSNLTKDILNEGTEEVIDPTAELQVAKEKIQQQELQLSTLKHENERLKRLNRELEEKAETSELQINAITSQYRSLLEDKEKEINNLKLQHHELLEQHVRTELTTQQGDYDQTWADHDFSSVNNESSDWDFDDSIKLQKENNRLQAELQHIRSEVKHWRTVAKQLGQAEGQSLDKQVVSADIIELQQKIKNLELQLTQKTEELQQQATSLHEHHQQKVSALKLKHQGEINALQQRLSSLEHQLNEANDGCNSSQYSGSGTLAEADRVDGHFDTRRETTSLETKDLASRSGQNVLNQHESDKDFPNASKQADNNVTSLQNKLQESELWRSQLEQQVKVLKEELVRNKYQLLDQLDANHADAQGVLCDLRVLRESWNYEALSLSEKIRSEKRSMANQLFRVVQQKNILTQSLRETKDEQEKLLEQTGACIEELTKRNQHISLDIFDKIEKENLTLKAEILKYEEQITLLEKKAAVFASENQSLVQKVDNLKSLLREHRVSEDHEDSEDTLDMKSSSPSSEHKSSALHVKTEDIDREIAQLRAELNSRSDELANVEMERTDWQMEKDALEDIITELRQKSQNLEQEVQSLKSGSNGISSDSDEVQDKVQALEAEISSLQLENTELKNALEELDEQHAEAVEQLIQKRNQLASQLSEKNMEITHQQETIEMLNKTVVELQESLRGSDQTNASSLKDESIWKEKCQKYESDLQELSRKLFEATKSDATVEKEMADLRQKLHKGGQVINDLHMDKQELKEELERAQSETASKVSKIKEMREELKILSGQKKQLEAELQGMQGRLSEAEQEVEKWQQMNENQQIEKMNIDVKLKECTELQSKLATLEEQKNLFSFNFEQLLSNQLEENVKESPLKDSAFQKILEKEASVRRQIESDGKLINDLRQQVQKLYNDKQTLKQQLHETQANTSEEMRHLQKELEASQKIVSDMQQRLDQESGDKQSLLQSLLEANHKLEELVKTNEILTSEVSSLKAEKSNLSRQLAGQIETLKSNHDSESLLEENKKLLEVQGEITLKLEKLEAEVKDTSSLKSLLSVKCQELEDLEHKFVSAQTEVATLMEQMIQLQALCDQKDQEVIELKSNLVTLETESPLGKVNSHNEQSDMELNVQGSNNLNRQADSQFENVEISKLTAELEKLKTQQDFHNGNQLEKELLACRETISRLQYELQAAQETIQCQEAGIADLNEKSDEHRRALEKSVLDLTRHKSTLAVLRQTSVDKETLLNETEAKLNFLITILTSEQLEMLTTFTQSGRPALEYKEIKALEYTTLSSSDELSSSSSTSLQSVVQIDQKVNSDKTYSSSNEYIVEENVEGSDQDRYFELEAEIERLCAELKEKDLTLTELQKSNAAFLALFEKGGGDKNISNQFEAHKLEAELRDLKSEREQLMAVVTEKSREASSLKLETHRLMTALSASQTALSKLQDDNRELQQQSSSHSLDEEVDDMRREALANMARLVRDKETEVEALKQKNETLLAVLQSSNETQAASHLAPLLKDRETFTQQIATLTSEREQLIACITQKHAESVAFHAETLRLSGLLGEMQAAYDKVNSEYQALIPKFDDKAQALVAAQNELIQCKQKLAAMEVRHGELIQRSNSVDISKTDTSSLEAELETLKQTESTLKLELCQRDEKVQSLNHRISTLEEELVSKESECAHLRKQLENAKFQLTGLLSEIADLKTDREQTQRKSVSQETECAALREACNKLTMEVKEKDGSITALRDQVATLTSVLHERQGEQGHISKLMKENHEVVSLTQQLQHERDQLIMFVEQRKQECENLRSEVSYYKDKECKISREVERLRHHLIETEEGYTKEALESEEREKDLRNKLAMAEEQAMQYHSRMEMASQENLRHLEGLQVQLQQVCTQRDSAYMQLANLQDQCQQYATSLSNLQLVLEHFQKEKEAAIAAETDHLERECKTLRQELEEKKRELSAIKDDLTEALEGLEAASRLSEQLDRKEEAITALKEEVVLRERALEAAENEIHKLTSTSEAKVDKTLMHNMVMTWLTSPDSNRSEIVNLIGHVLSFSNEDFQKIEMAQTKRGLLSGIFSRTPVKEWTPSKPAPSNQSFSQLFVKFLEKESSPPSTPVRLPAEAMAAEAQQRHKSPFNPFTAPRHVTHDTQKSSSPSTHLLISNDMGPMPSALFAPISNTHTLSESAILKDVLGKR
ncbi:thyroid receptor-interacting protein 11-like isoform X2 [Biomphalaria glabrata]|uniref:Thyroid receptor-interacting protein 11-like isoform X2 n=1 Tax=Biomphalaria glabrata TaxID=6526 RepID=A0A9W2ZT64_BIOGL|nr:thyroid receptor-interacting protein 11-like isoform X2 [Biomphalaria glabrata]